MGNAKIRNLRKLCPPGTVFRWTGKQHIAIQIPGVVGEVITSSTPRATKLSKVKKQIDEAVKTGVASPTIRKVVKSAKRNKE